MGSFNYVAKDSVGKTLKGIITANSSREVVSKLQQEGLYIIQIDSLERQIGVESKSRIRGRVGLKDKMFFTKQFGVMIRAGLGMVVCLNNLISQTSNKYFQYILNEVRKDIEGGGSLSTAMAKHPKVFDKIFVNMMEAGEASGKLDVSLERLNEFYEREFTIRKKIVSALVYPGIILSVAIIVVIILVTIVLPMFAQVFADSGVQLPLVTRMLLGFSDFCRRFWFLLPGFPILFIFGYRAAQKNPIGKKLIDTFWLKVPIVGTLVHRILISRFTRTFGTLIDSGVPLLQSLGIVENVVENVIISQSLKNASVSVSRGTGLAQPLESSGMFPPMVSQMVSVGEETGNLSHMLEEIANYYDKEVEYAVENVTAMIEPVIIVFLGGVVGMIVAAIMLPMFDISSGSTMGK